MCFHLSLDEILDLERENREGEEPQGWTSQPSQESRPPDPNNFGNTIEGVIRSYTLAIRGPEKASFPVIELTRRQPHKKEGKPTIIFIATEIVACSKQMQHALVAKFTLGHPHVAKIEKEFRAACKLDGPMMVSDQDGRYMMLFLSLEKDTTIILTQGLRQVGTSLFYLFRWTLEFQFRQESTVISIWIRFPHLTPDLFNEGALRCLC
uniref:DUF4283 domain-containing protein n=1 Tax=Kalanchoe fedtschenkoi TaxID=63787 RepID=A0A7N0TPI8_KALFE